MKERLAAQPAPRPWPFFDLLITIDPAESGNGMTHSGLSAKCSSIAFSAPSQCRLE